MTEGLAAALIAIGAAGAAEVTLRSAAGGRRVLRLSAPRAL
ncbi:MAG: hypothetical protein AAF322_21840 [Pseudomonadota bacterium]